MSLAVVLTEALTGDHRRDFHKNRLLRTCDVRTTDEALARKGATLRTAVERARAPSAVDAIVVARWGESMLSISQHDLVETLHHMDTLASDSRVHSPGC